MRWIYRHTLSTPPPNDLDAWAKRLQISSLLAELLWHRGVGNNQGMHDFLSPSLGRLSPLGEWPGLEDAGQLLAKSLLEGKQFCVWGDYDVDGLTSAAVVWEAITGFGFSCQHHIPDRLTDGYGLNIQGIEALAAQGITGLITVDTGIADIETITRAKELGLTVILTDHHLPGPALPPADAIVNPRLAPCPCPALAGVGTAFLLMAATNVALHQLTGRPKGDIRSLLDLVALGTLADVVDVKGENRILIKAGLDRIAQGKRVGIAALKSASGFAPTAHLGAGQIVFALAPRINAAGRLGRCEVALELLLTHDKERAALLAEELSRLNAERRSEEERILDEAMQQAQEQAKAGALGLVLYGEHLAPRYYWYCCFPRDRKPGCPTVVLSFLQKYLKGSARSVGDFNLYDAFAQSADLLLGFGGHKMAAGLSLLPENLQPFRQRFNALAQANFGVAVPEQECKIDADLNFADASDFTLLKELELLQPFGMGNAEPVFASPLVRVTRMRPAQGHMQLDLTDEATGITLRAKAWRQLANIPVDLKGKKIRIAYTPRIDRYNGVASVELRLKDWKTE